MQDRGDLNKSLIVLDTTVEAVGVTNLRLSLTMASSLACDPRRFILGGWKGLGTCLAWPSLTHNCVCCRETLSRQERREGAKGGYLAWFIADFPLKEKGVSRWSESLVSRHRGFSFLKTPFAPPGRLTSHPTCIKRGRKRPSAKIIHFLAEMGESKRNLTVTPPRWDGNAWGQWLLWFLGGGTWPGRHRWGQVYNQHHTCPQWQLQRQTYRRLLDKCHYTYSFYNVEICPFFIYCTAEHSVWYRGSRLIKP